MKKASSKQEMETNFDNYWNAIQKVEVPDKLYYNIQQAVIDSRKAPLHKVMLIMLSLISLLALEAYKIKEGVNNNKQEVLKQSLSSNNNTIYYE